MSFIIGSRCMVFFENYLNQQWFLTSMILRSCIEFQTQMGNQLLLIIELLKPMFLLIWRNWWCLLLLCLMIKIFLFVFILDMRSKRIFAILVDRWDITLANAQNMQEVQCHERRKIVSWKRMCTQWFPIEGRMGKKDEVASCNFTHQWLTHFFCWKWWTSQSIPSWIWPH